MIEFQYKKEQDDSFLITLKTDITEAGTFHRMATVIYDLGWDIISGEIDTIEENGINYSYDTLRLSSPGSDNVRSAMEIGFMLDSLFSGHQKLTELPPRVKVKEPPVFFFREKAELIFQDEPEKNWTIFYIEADSGKGLLYHLTDILLEYNINILKGKIDTDPVTLRARDTFYVQDESGNMFGTKKLAVEVRKKILDSLSIKPKEE